MDEVLRNALLRIPYAKSASGGEEVVLRCPYCGDSVRNSNHVHFYVGSRDGVYFYDCKRCPASGVLSAAVLSDLEVHDLSAVDFVKSIKSTNRTVKINGNKDDKIHYQMLTTILPEDNAKLDYISTRAKLDFSTPDNIRSYKIIYRLNDFIRANNLVPNQPSEIMRDFSDNYVGFLSQNKGSILLRNVSSTKSNRRYLQYRIDANRKQPFIYIPPCTIDPLTPRPRIVMSEGPFDIICVKNQFFPQDDTTTIFAASGSKGSYKSALMQLLKYSGFMGAEVSIFSDMDDRKKGYEPILRELREDVFKPFLNSFDFTVLFNADENQKDFGYTADSWEIKKFSLSA